MGNDPSAYNSEIVENWKPNMFLSVMDDSTGRLLSAAIINSKRRKIGFLHSLLIQCKGLDYIIFEALSRSTIGGSIFQSIVKFIVGTGFRPELELINAKKENVIWTI